MSARSAPVFFAVLSAVTACGPKAPAGRAARPAAAPSPGICAETPGPFSLAIDNPFFPLPVGRKLTLDGREGKARVHLEVTVLDQTEVVAGVTTRVVEERESEEGQVVEVSRNFFAQAPDGTVCYFGEDVDELRAGAVVGHEGSWRAGGPNHPGIMMPAAPRVGVAYSQEVAPGVAEDAARIEALGEAATLPAGRFADTLRTSEWSPLEPGVSEAKRYARGVGIVVDGSLELTAYR